MLAAGFLGTLPQGKGKSRQSPISREQIPCPLCGNLLAPGQRVRTLAYPGKREKLVHILGCPFCLPGRQSTGTPRICPSCRRQIPPQGYLIGKMWEEGSKTRVHVLGCSSCLTKGG